eukprot:g14210.t1
MVSGGSGCCAGAMVKGQCCMGPKWMPKSVRGTVGISRPAMRRVQQVRQMSGSAEEAVKDMETAKKACYAGAAIVGALCAINVIIHFNHEHGHEPPAYSYRRIRNKPMPWSEEDCDLFDLDCKAKFRAAKA